MSQTVVREPALIAIVVRAAVNQQKNTFRQGKSRRAAGFLNPHKFAVLKALLFFTDLLRLKNSSCYGA